MKRAIVALSLLLNLASLAVIAWLLLGEGRRTVLYNFVGGSYERWVSQYEILEVVPGGVVFLGDSITQGGSWHELFPGVAVHNRGLGGDVAPGVLERLDQVTRGRPGKVFLKIGTNDLAIGNPEDEIVANIGEIVDRIHAESPGAAVYVQSLLPREADFRAPIESLNARLREAAPAHGARFVDLYPLFLAGDGSLRDELTNDELHLTGRGYLVWRDAIDPLVRGEEERP